MAIKKVLQIPFSEDGNMYNYAGFGQPFGATWVDNFEFSARLKIYTYARGNSSATFKLRCIITGKEYSIFMSEMMYLISQKTINKGVVTGKWTFIKQGQNFSIKLVS